MKEKIKKMIFTIAIIYSIVVVVLMLYSYNTSTNMMEFNDDSENINLLNEYKKDLINIKDSICKNALNDLIEHYEKTSYNGIVNLKDKYLSEDVPLKYATAIIKDCNLNDNIRKNIAFKVLTASVQSDEILKELYFQYEIKMPDINNRSIMETNLYAIRYTINRQNQLEIIKMLIDVLKGEQ